MKKSSAEWHGCPIRYGGAIFGDIWSLLILRDIMFKDARHYADFLNAGEGISTNILASRLSKLEAEGILTKAQDPGNKARYLYGLTDKGKGLVPVLLEIMCWSETWDDQTEVPKDFARALKEDRAALVKNTIAKL
nr:helix-turn-helix domain-containing protein [Rhodophyticola sp. CCM32]